LDAWEGHVGAIIEGRAAVKVVRRRQQACFDLNQCLRLQSAVVIASASVLSGVEVSKTTPTVIVASSVLLREGIVFLLQATSYKVTGAVATPTELPSHHFVKNRCSLAIVEIDWQNGIQGQTAENIRLLRSLMPGGKIVLIAETSRPVDLPSVLALAADGYILNLESRDLLLKSLELMLIDHQIIVLGRSTAALTTGASDTQLPDGTVGSQPGSSYEFGENTHDEQLSHRERQVLICLARGESNKAIARLCHISEATVKVHLKAILRKINGRNRTQAAIWAIKHGLRDYSPLEPSRINP
jgi:two-component system, NarL family, nitrate/nitrite response regulator NarL